MMYPFVPKNGILEFLWLLVFSIMILKQTSSVNTLMKTKYLMALNNNNEAKLIFLFPTALKVWYKTSLVCHVYSPNSTLCQEFVHYFFSKSKVTPQSTNCCTCCAVSSWYENIHIAIKGYLWNVNSLRYLNWISHQSLQ